MLVCSLALAACGDGDRNTATLEVTAGFYPLYEAARAIGGDQARVVNLTPAGTGPHDLELAPRAVAQVQDADLNLYLGQDFQPAVQRAVAQGAGRAVDLLGGLRLRRTDGGIPGVRGEVDGERLAGDRDPHVWVDPAGFTQIVDRITAGYMAADSDRASTWRANARRYRDRIVALDTEFRTGLRRCATRTLVTSHAAFGYLADRYDLDQAPIAGISPDDEPDPRSLAAVAARAKRDGVETVFFETLVPRKLSETVAQEIGARTDALDPIEGLTTEDERAGKTYVSIQRDNLERLRRGLRCTEG